MYTDYVTKLLVDQRVAELHREADHGRLAREIRAGQHRPRWWERLMLFRTGAQTPTPRPAAPRPVAPQPAATAAADSPC